MVSQYLAHLSIWGMEERSYCNIIFFGLCGWFWRKRPQVQKLWGPFCVGFLPLLVERGAKEPYIVPRADWRQSHFETFLWARIGKDSWTFFIAKRFCQIFTDYQRIFTKNSLLHQLRGLNRSLRFDGQCRPGGISSEMQSFERNRLWSVELRQRSCNEHGRIISNSWHRREL